MAGRAEGATFGRIGRGWAIARLHGPDRPRIAKRIAKVPQSERPVGNNWPGLDWLVVTKG
jgi:hypothetical protein